MNYNANPMVVDKEYKKKLSGFVNHDDLSKELDKLLKYHDAENIQPDLAKTKKILNQFNVNEELVNMRE